jgi:hypothetical protein
METRTLIWSDESFFTLFPTSGRVYVWRTPKEGYNPECLAPGVKYGGGEVLYGLDSNIMVQYPAGPIITLHGRVSTREYVDRLANTVQPMIQTLFPNDDAVSQGDNAPIHIAGFEEHESKLQHLPWPAQSPYLNNNEPLLTVLETRLWNRFPPPKSLKQLEDVFQEVGIIFR